MKALKNHWTMTPEAESAGLRFFEDLHNACRRSKVSDTDCKELSDSLLEHLDFSFQTVFDRKNVDIIDAQIMIETLSALGSPDELASDAADSKSSESAENTNKANKVDSSLFEQNDSSNLNFKTETSGNTFYKNFCDQQSLFLGRVSEQAVFKGVCAGISRYFDIPTFLVRLIFVLGFVLSLPLYFLLYSLMPDSNEIKSNRQAVVKANYAASVIRWGSRSCIFMLAHFPAIVLMLGIILFGCSKVLSESGIISNPLFGEIGYFTMGFIGLVAGLTEVIMGCAFLAILLHFSGRLFGLKSILTPSTRQLLLIAGAFGMFIHFVLGFWGAYSTRFFHQSKEDYVIPECLPGIIEIQGPDSKRLLKRLTIDVIEDKSIDRISVSLTRSAYGRTVEHAESIAGEIILEPLIQKNGNNGQTELFLPLTVKNGNWWFSPSLSARVTIRIPRLPSGLKLHVEGNPFFGQLNIENFNAKVWIESQGFEILNNGCASESVIINAGK